MAAWLYILRLHSGGLYVGSTVDLSRRAEDHFRGSGCRTTRLDPPTEIVYQEQYETFEQAEQRELQLKRWSRARKETLIRGDIHSVKAPAIRRTQ